VLNGCASLALIEELLVRFGFRNDIRSTLLTAGRVLALAFVLQLFFRHVVIGQISTATPLNLVVRDELYFRSAQETGDALLKSNIPVVSSSIQHTRVGPRVGDELIARIDADMGVCLLDSMSFPDVGLRVYRRDVDRRRPVRNCAAPV